MRRWRLQYAAACLAAWSGAAPAPAPAWAARAATPEEVRRAAAISEADRVAAESLRRSADSLLYVPADTPGRGGRILALARMADRLQGGDPRTNWLLAGIYQAQGKDSALLGALGVCLAANPQDYLLGLRYVRLNLDVLDTSVQRLECLRAFVKNPQYSPLLRAEAYACMGQVLRGQGKPAEARSAFEQAIALDPGQPDAVQGDLELRKDATGVQRLRATLAMIRGNPRRADLAVQAGTLLEEMALYSQALVFYDHAWAMAGQAGDRTLQIFILPRYCNAMLAAGDNRRAVITFTPILGQMPSPDLESLLIEAYQDPALNDPVRAAQLRTDLRKLLQDRYDAAGREALKQFEPATSMPTTASRPGDANAWTAERQAAVARARAEPARDLAWFYILTGPDAAQALSYARQAAAVDLEDPVVQRVLGVAEVQTGRTGDGLGRLQPLARTDAYAARFLADYYFARNQPIEANQAIQDGVVAGRTGPAYRQLAALAKRRGLGIPAAPGAVEGLAIYESFDPRYLEMPQAPDKYISVRIRAVKDPVLPGEPLSVEATLTNLSNVEVPVGDWGLVDPHLGLAVKIWGARDTFENLPVLSWPVSRSLPPGSAYTLRADLDVGVLGRFLAQRPLEDFALQIAGALAPVQRGSRVASSLPGLTLPTASVKRMALVNLAEANDPPKLARACSTHLGRIVYDLKNGNLLARMQAVRQIASLLALQRQSDLGKAPLAKPVAEALARGVLLSMVVEALKDPSDVVRSEMLAALQIVPLDNRIVALLGPAIEDVSPLVRMRLAELLGATGLAGQNTVLDYLRRDPDEMVRLMASAFAPAKRKG